MNNSKTPKIVVGVVLAALYATALAAALIPRGAHDSAVAVNSSVAPPAQLALAPDPAAAIAPASVDASTSPAEQPAPAIDAAAPVSSSLVNVPVQPSVDLAAALPVKERENEQPGRTSPVASADPGMASAEVNPATADVASEESIESGSVGELAASESTRE